MPVQEDNNLKIVTTCDIAASTSAAAASAAASRSSASVVPRRRDRAAPAHAHGASLSSSSSSASELPPPQAARALQQQSLLLPLPLQAAHAPIDGPGYGGGGGGAPDPSLLLLVSDARVLHFFALQWLPAPAPDSEWSPPEQLDSDSGPVSEPEARLRPGESGTGSGSPPPARSTLPSPPSLSSVQQPQLRRSLSEWIASFPAWAAQLADPAAGSVVSALAGAEAGAVPVTCRRCTDLPLPLPAWASRAKAGLTEALRAGGYVATRPERSDHVVQLDFDAGVWRSVASRGVDAVVAQAAAAAPEVEPSP